MLSHVRIMIINYIKHVLLHYLLHDKSDIIKGVSQHPIKLEILLYMYMTKANNLVIYTTM